MIDNSILFSNVAKILEKNHKFIDAYINAREHILSGKAYDHLKNIQNG